MKPRFALACMLLVVSAGCSSMGGGLDIGTAISAGGDLYKAADISDKEVQSMALQFSKESDRQNQIASASNAYGKRLARLTSGFGKEDGLNLNFKAYMSPEVNAFALANGSVRVYSGLMDKMNDDELRFVLGHEIGHVKEGHSKNKLRMTYATSALRKGVASSNTTAGVIAASEVGGLAEAVINSQYSQSEEESADDYGLSFLKRHKISTAAGPTALRKLATISGGEHSFLSTHPDPEDRAERLEEAMKG